MSSKRLSISDLRSARASHEERLSSYPNVRGTALGVKRKGDILTGDSAVVIFVQEKISKSDLGEGAIPKELVIGHKRVLTDVVELRGLKTQFGDPPYFCYDGVKQGTVSTMCRFYNNYYAVTCAHCIEGPDLNPYTQDNIQFYHPPSQTYITVGRSSYVVWSDGLPGKYGFSDAGIFTVKDKEILARCAKAKTMPCWNNPKINTNVYTITSNRRLFGKIECVEGSYGSVFADIIIRVDEPGTFDGDSGCIWRTQQSGLAVAMHALGSVETDRPGSRLSFNMSVRRMLTALQVTLLEI